MLKDEHRRATARIRVLNADGIPAGNCPIRIDQVSHSFLFGCGVFDTVELMKTESEQKRAVLQQRMEKWLALFNYGTLPFYWGRYEPEENRTAYAETRRAAEWLHDRGIRVKGHPLCWHTVCAPWLLQYSNDEIYRRQMARIRRDVGDYRGVIDFWDVVNEAVIMPDFDRYDNAVTRICQAKGRIRLVKEAFTAAKETDPEAVLLLNDFNTSPDYEVLISELLDVGAPIDVIGIQSHQHQGYWGLEKLQNVLDRFSRFGLPIHFTENTLISGELMPAHIVDLNDWQVDAWPSTPEGEERQAREIREMVNTLFAHPLVEAITAWDFIDGCWLNAPSGLLRADGREKPAYHVLRELIHGEWETHITLSTNEDGIIEFTGYKGGYEITSNAGKAKLTLMDNMNSDIVVSLEMMNR